MIQQTKKMAKLNCKIQGKILDFPKINKKFQFFKNLKIRKYSKENLFNTQMDVNLKANTLIAVKLIRKANKRRQLIITSG